MADPFWDWKLSKDDPGYYLDGKLSGIFKSVDLTITQPRAQNKATYLCDVAKELPIYYCLKSPFLSYLCKAEYNSCLGKREAK